MINRTNESDPRTIHAQAIKYCATEKSAFNNIITLYSKSHSNLHLCLSYAHRVFHYQIPKPTVASWTSLISAFAGTPSSLTHFAAMLRHPALPSQRTLAVLFKTCAHIGAFSFGLQLHAIAAKLSVATQPFSGSSLVSFYSKSGFFGDARKAFDEMPDWDQVSFASLIVGLSQNSRPIDALSCFANMVGFNVRSTAYSLSGTVSAAARIMGLEQCRMLHCHSVVTGLDQDLIVGTSLIDGYGKCGLVSDAREVFDELLPCMNVVGWNAMMAGYAQQGDSMLVLSLLRLMKVRGLVPDEYSFLAVLTSLANAGLVDETGKWLSKMKVDYGVEPEIEHYACFVGALAGCGRLQDAEKVVTTMPFEPNAALWRLLLTACATHGAVDMAHTIRNKLASLHPDDETWNILANNGRFEEVAEMSKTTEDRMVKKVGGKSWVEYQGKAHVFLAGDQTHPRKNEIYRMLAELITKSENLGYRTAPHTNSGEIKETEKSEGVHYHSLKLALAFAVVSGAAVAPSKPIRIMKNLRICKECHESFKFFCRVLDREIIVRDVNRYHRFVYGRCSCGDYW
uniref:DYW domain-containing protein n=1 Tax=Kalanchoe fedtschenkoi TaxID=63787 RepID=A0A7N0V870_KALFE